MDRVVKHKGASSLSSCSVTPSKSAVVQSSSISPVMMSVDCSKLKIQKPRAVNFELAEDSKSPPAQTTFTAPAAEQVAPTKNPTPPAPARPKMVSTSQETMVAPSPTLAQGDSFSDFLKKTAAAAAAAASSPKQPIMVAPAPPVPQAVSGAATSAPIQIDGTPDELSKLVHMLSMSPEQKTLAEKFLSKLVIEPCKAPAESTEQQKILAEKFLSKLVIEPCKAHAESTEAASFTKSEMQEKIDKYSPKNVSIITDENKKILKDMLDGERNNVRIATLEEAIKGLLTHLLNIEEGQISSLTQQVGGEDAATGLMKIQTTKGQDIVVKLSTQDEVNLNKKLETKFQGEDSPLVMPWGHFCIPGTDLVLLFMDEQGKDGLELINGALKNAIDSKNESVLVAVAKELLNKGLSIINEMHKQDTLHRDPKLENLVLSSDGTLKKIDLSDAVLLGDGVDSTEHNTRKGSFSTYSHNTKFHYTKSDDIEHFFRAVYQTLNNIQLESIESFEMPELNNLIKGIDKLLNRRCGEKKPLNLQKLLEDALQKPLELETPPIEIPRLKKQKT
jgi:hypothetical protein